MKVIDAQKMRDYFYWGINDEPIFDCDTDRKIIEMIDACTVEINVKEKRNEAKRSSKRN